MEKTLNELITEKLNNDHKERFFHYYYLDK